MHIRSSRLLTITSVALKSWWLYKSHFKQLVPYMLVGLIPTLLWGLAPIFAEQIAFGLYIGGLIIVAILLAWYYVSLIKALGSVAQGSSAPHWKTSLGESLPLLWPLFYTLLLVALIIVGGLILLIIPGIIFLNWFTFTMYEIVLNQKRGRAALKGSKDLVSGRWWEILFNMSIPSFILSIPVAAIIFILALPLMLLLGDESTLSLTLQAIITSVLGLVLAPLTMFAPVVVYLDARENPVETQELI